MKFRRQQEGPVDADLAAITAYRIATDNRRTADRIAVAKYMEAFNVAVTLFATRIKEATPDLDDGAAGYVVTYFHAVIDYADSINKATTSHSEARKTRDASDYRFVSEERPAGHPSLGDAESTYIAATSAYWTTIRGATETLVDACTNYIGDLAIAKMFYPEASSFILQADDPAFVSGYCATIRGGTDESGVSRTEEDIAADFAGALWAQRQVVADCNRGVLYTEAFADLNTACDDMADASNAAVKTYNAAITTAETTVNAATGPSFEVIPRD